jgi:hypothetical protein
LELDSSSKLKIQLDVTSEAQGKTLATEDKGGAEWENPQIVLLRVSPKGIVEIPLSALSYRILEAFSQKKTVGEVTGKLMKDGEFEQFDEMNELRLVLVGQIKEALRVGILTPQPFSRS